MSKNLLLTGALAAVLLCFGIVIGRETSSEPMALAPAAPASAPADTPAPAPRLLGLEDHARSAEGSGPCCDELLARLGRLDDAVAGLSARVAAMQKSVEPAGTLLSFFQSKIPEFAKSRAAADQTAAVATLRNVCSAQAQFQASGKADRDGDGTGEYGGFVELSGAAAGRMRSVLVPAVLSSAFRTLNEHGEAMRSGYLYRFYLPGPMGEGIGEPRDGFSNDSGVDSDLSETTWCCYAWPVDAAEQGGLVVFMNQGGDILTTVDPRYSGPGRGPAPDAAFLSRGAITGAVALGATGQDGNTWSFGLPKR